FKIVFLFSTHKKCPKKCLTFWGMSISPLDSLKIKYNLTNRETEVLTCLWEGMSNIQISEKLFISVSTVKYHVKNLYTKLEINNRSEALYLKKTYSK
ncbi:LuxR C-terminal-related transcriptional regulator, partial [Myroides phaeus]|uniref:response regulator transcription factor n=1 Tax=Myroides phaeus TaxID=702745 RepID=UPI002DBB0415